MAANLFVRDAFKPYLTGSRTAILLDTPALRTTLTLLETAADCRITIVEIESDVARVMSQNLEKLGLSRQVTVVCANVFDYLAARAEPADCVWLDLMASNVRSPRALGALVRRLRVSCLAITLTGRGQISYVRRIRSIETALSAALPYKSLDWGYRLSPRHQPMFLTIFERSYAETRYRPLSWKELNPRDAAHICVAWWGYPGEWTIERRGEILSSTRTGHM